MEQLSFFDRVRELFNLIFSSSFFISLFIILILTVVLLIINIKTNKKIFKILSSCIYVGIVMFVAVKYFPSLSDLTAKLLDKIFTVLYFPNYISYICMLIISVLLFIIIMINTRVSKMFKTINIVTFILLFFLFVLTIDIITNNNIDIYNKNSLYSNQTLIVLIQSSMGIFALWFASLIVDTFVNYIVRHDNKEKVQEQMFNNALSTAILNDKLVTLADDDFTVLSEDNFYNSYNKYAKKKQYEEYMDIVNNE